MIISGMAPTPERKKQVDFSDDYMEVNQRMIIQKRDKDKLKRLMILKGKWSVCKSKRLKKNWQNRNARISS